MQVVEFPLTPASADSFRFHTISKTDRARNSGPGLRAFVEVADRLGLNGTDRVAVLGHPAAPLTTGGSEKHQTISHLRCLMIRF